MKPNVIVMIQFIFIREIQLKKIKLYIRLFKFIR